MMLKNTLYCDGCGDTMPLIPNRSMFAVDGTSMDICINCKKKPISYLEEVAHSIENRGKEGNFDLRRFETNKPTA